MPPNSVGQHLLQTTRQGEGRATRGSEKEGEEPGGGGTQGGRAAGLTVQGLVLGRVPTQIYKDFEGAWRMRASRKEFCITSSKPPAVSEMRSVF